MWSVEEESAQRRRRATFLFSAALTLGVLALVSPLAQAQATASPGTTTSGTVTSNGSEFEYLLYTPSSYVPARPAPLVVVAHGCQTTAAQEQQIAQYDRVADREGIVVLYPDVDAVGRALPGPLNQCWKFWDAASSTRDSGDSGAIADMTRAAMATLSVDPERVYIAGISAGGLMASIEAAAYPDLYAAAAVMSSSSYADWSCFTTGLGTPAAVSAQLAFNEMGSRARVVPIFVLGGDADQAFPWSCTGKALEQGLRTNNLVISGAQGGPLALAAAELKQVQVPGGYSSTVASYRDGAGCLVAEGWRVHGMGHFWSGGTTDPAYAGFTDVRGPSAAEATWAFFSRYTKRGTDPPCSEAKGSDDPPRASLCPRRKIVVRLRAGARRARASVNGRRVKARRSGRRLLVTLPAGDRVRTVVRVKARTRGGRLVRKTGRYGGCGPRKAARRR